MWVTNGQSEWHAPAPRHTPTHLHQNKRWKPEMKRKLKWTEHLCVSGADGRLGRVGVAECDNISNYLGQSNDGNHGANKKAEKNKCTWPLTFYSNRTKWENGCINKRFLLIGKCPTIEHIWVKYIRNHSRHCYTQKTLEAYKSPTFHSLSSSVYLSLFRSPSLISCCRSISINLLVSIDTFINRFQH